MENVRTSKQVIAEMKRLVEGMNITDFNMARDPSKNDIQNLYKALVNNDFSETRYYNGMIISTPTGYYLLDDVVFSNGPACGFTVANGSYYFHPENVNIEDVKQHLKKVAEDKDDLLDYVDGTKSF